jgi:ATP-dependent Zn protease
VVFVVLWLIRSTFGSQFQLGNGPKEIPYSQFIEEIKAKGVEKGEFQKDKFQGKLSSAGSAPGGAFYVNVPDSQFARSNLYDLLSANGVTYKVAQPPYPRNRPQHAAGFRAAGRADRCFLPVLFAAGAGGRQPGAELRPGAR